MKCFALLAALCFLGVCAGDSLSVDFLNQNLLNPMLDQIYNSASAMRLFFSNECLFCALDAIGMLGSQLSTLLAGLFGGIGKRGLSDVLSINLSQVSRKFRESSNCCCLLVQGFGSICCPNQRNLPTRVHRFPSNRSKR